MCRHAVVLLGERCCLAMLLGLRLRRMLTSLALPPQALTNVDKGRSKKRHEVGVRLPGDPGVQGLGWR